MRGRIKPLFSRHRSSLDMPGRLTSRYTCDRHISFYRGVTLFKGFATPPPSRWLRGGQSYPWFLRHAHRGLALVTRRYVHLPDWLLHLLHHQPVGWRGIQPSYCFRGATATHWRSINRIGVDSRIPFRLATIHVPLCLHAGIWFANLILAHCSCRRFLACWHQGAEKPSLTSPYPPFLPTLR